MSKELIQKSIQAVIELLLGVLLVIVFSGTGILVSLFVESNLVQDGIITFSLVASFVILTFMMLRSKG